MIIFENKIILLLPKNGTHSIMMEHGVNPWDGPGSYTRLNKNDALIFLDGDSPHLPANRIPKRFEHLPNYALVRNPWFRTITRYFWTKRRNWFEEKISIDEYVEQKYFPEKLKGDYIYEEWAGTSWRPQIEWFNEKTIVSKFEDYNFKFHFNESKNKYNIKISKKTANLIGDYYLPDIKKFNYNVPEGIIQ